MYSGSVLSFDDQPVVIQLVSVCESARFFLKCWLQVGAFVTDTKRLYLSNDRDNDGEAEGKLRLPGTCALVL